MSFKGTTPAAADSRWRTEPPTQPGTYWFRREPSSKRDHGGRSCHGWRVDSVVAHRRSTCCEPERPLARAMPVGGWSYLEDFPTGINSLLIRVHLRCGGCVLAPILSRPTARYLPGLFILILETSVSPKTLKARTVPSSPLPLASNS